MSRVALVTGAGGGIGLEICRQLLESGDTVVACPRVSGSEGLSGLAREHPDRLHKVPVDVGDEAALTAAVPVVEQRVDHLDLLVNNAGIYPKTDGGLEQLDPANLVRAFEINAVAPLLVTRAFLPLLRRGSGRRLIQVTSLMGSIQDNTSGGSWAYRMSKSALNMAVRNLGHELGHDGFVCVAIHPGWVQTRMGGAGAPTPLREGTAEVLRVALGATVDDNGGFLGPGGKHLPY